MPRAATVLRRIAGLVAGVLLALALGVLVPLSPDRPAATQRAAGAGAQAVAGGGQRILILSGPIHTDIALPATPDLRRRFGFLEEAGLPIGRPDVAHVVVGWGGRSFYLETPTWGDLRPLPLLRSFTSDASVLHVELTGAIDAGAPGTRAIDLDAAGFEALLVAVEATLSRDAAGGPIAIEGSGYGAFDRFFEAEGRFNAVLGCNVWTARTLRAAGLATGLWTPLPQTLIWSLDLHA